MSSANAPTTLKQDWVFLDQHNISLVMKIVYYLHLWSFSKISIFIWSIGRRNCLSFDLIVYCWINYFAASVKFCRFLVGSFMRDCFMLEDRFITFIFCISPSGRISWIWTHYHQRFSPVRNAYYIVERLKYMFISIHI